ncbi:hypothetical protein GF359_06275 [candidate division WOR-3 bacterium]|uniref:Lipid A biosynthesis acyltransferase n=1 Tax=candidate division WOR-3 bacterium TaxID=2052148 RepID=A0A9D5K9Z7_UNCW3|nr:hypothetical protein [candidate division WOR-3 bacterium]MBD3364805.1 hypothetical protein [candidate division WOR-3 bacterium]
MFIIFLLLTLRVLPFELSCFIARLVFSLFLKLSPRARSQLFEAEDVLGKKRYPSSIYIKRAAFNIAVMARMGSTFTRNLYRKMMIEGEEYIKLLKDSHNSAIIATFHYGPWELLAEAFSAKGYKIAALVTKQSRRLLDRFLLALRKRVGLKIVHTWKQASELTKKGFFLATLFDKTVRAKWNKMNFPLPNYQTSRLPIRLAERIRKPLIPVMCRFKDRKFQVNIGPPKQDKTELQEFYSPFFTQTPFEWLIWGD